MLRKIFSFLVLVCTAINMYGQDQVDKLLVMDYLQEQQHEKIIRYMEETVQPQHVNGLTILANAYFQSGQLAQAEKQYLRVLGLDSNYIPALQQLGVISRTQQQYARAFTCYSRLISLRPDVAFYYKQQALSAASITGMQDSAFQIMKTAYRLNTKDVGIVTFLADEYTDRKEYLSADTVLLGYYATDSTHPAILTGLVKSAFYQSRYQDVVNFGERSLSLNIINPMSGIYTAVAHYTLKHYDSCIRVEEKFTELTNASPESLKYYAALSYAQKKNYDKSNELLQACIEIAKSKTLEGYYTALADNYEAMKQFRKAISHYDTAYYLFKDPMRQYGIARIYDQYIQDPSQAKKYYQRFLKDAKPENKNEKEIQKYVQERVKSL